MWHTIVYRALWVAMLTLDFVPQGVNAEETRFICSDEQAANTIGEQVVISQEAADNAAHEYLEKKVCVYLPYDVHIDIIYHGKTFRGKDLVVEVVGFFDDTNTKMFFGLMRVTENGI